MKNTLYNIIIIILFFITGICVNANNTDEPDNVPKIREGTFIKLMARDEISTLINDIEDEVTFINVSDMYVYEINAIPENTIFYGEIEDLKEPVEGKNGALKIHIYKMITPDKKVYKIKGHLYSENDNYIGGEQTPPAYYHKVPHYIKGFKPFLQAAPLNIYQFGQHTIIKPGTELFLILEKDIILK